MTGGGSGCACGIQLGDNGIFCQLEHGHISKHRSERFGQIFIWEERKKPAPLSEELARVSQILRTFVSSQVSLSTLQPVIDLAIELNPDLGLALVCGWCQKVLKAGRYPASHGICEACQLRAFNER